MKLSPAKIRAFQEIYKRQFGENISYEEAEEKGIALIELVKTMLYAKKKNAVLQPNKKVLL